MFLSGCLQDFVQLNKYFCPRFIETIVVHTDLESHWSLDLFPMMITIFLDFFKFE